MIVIVDYGSSNNASIQWALTRLGQPSVVSADATLIQQASHVILPGVGHAKAAMQVLQQCQLIPVLQQLQQPVLGICLGMQLFAALSAEGDTNCLNIIDVVVTPLPYTADCTSPHMGWNQLHATKDSRLLQQLPEPSYVYFVHRYALLPSVYTTAVTHHGQTFSAIVEWNNFYGVQFHPERSGSVGQQILRNFLEL